MAEDFAELALEASNPVIQNYDKVYDPLKEKAKKQADRLRNRGRDRGEYDEEYVEYDRYRDSDRRRGDDYYDERYERRDGGRAKSAGRDGYGGRGLRDDRRRYSRRSYSSDSSESSISPRRAYKHRKSLGEQALAALGLGGVLGAEKEREKDRRSSRERRSERESAYRREDRDRRYAEGSKQLPAGYLGYNERQDPRPDGSNAGTVARRSAYGGNQTAATTSNGDFENYRGRNRQSSDSSDSSSDVCSSSEDERRQKKLRGKEYLTAGLAAVATIHAAHGVYSSLEARDKRQLDVAKGEMAPEEAARLRRKAKLQDAAAIGIAALGIKGAYSEWQEVQEHRKELNMEKQERQKRHEKREKKRHKYGSIQGSSRNGGGGRNRSEPDFGRGYRDRN